MRSAMEVGMQVLEWAATVGLKAVILATVVSVGCIQGSEFKPSADISGQDSDQDTGIDLGRSDPGGSDSVSSDSDGSDDADANDSETSDPNDGDSGQSDPTPEDSGTQDVSCNDDLELCCTGDEDCTGYLLEEGEDVCNPARCREGQCQLAMAIDMPCEAGSPCMDGDHCVAADGLAVCQEGTTPVGCDDGKTCTTDSCAAATGCSNVMQAGWCLIGGSCYAEEEAKVGDKCQVCATAESQTEWSAAGEGTVCGTGRFCGSGICQPEMVAVPGGAFMQGCNSTVDTGCYTTEEPYHEVGVPQFYIDKYEVTFDAYESCVADGGCSTPGVHGGCNWGETGKGSYPVNCITWYQAGEYCAWAGKRLCSESEWEKASRGTDGRIFPWGNEPATCEYAVKYEDISGCGTDSTMAVGSMPAGASPYGALDMSGNLSEWVEDDYHSSYSGAPTNGSAWMDNPRKVSRVFRGGNLNDGGARLLRSSYRYYNDSAATYNYIGARCCNSP